MFKSDGFYYCLNACLDYPMDMEKIKGFLRKISADSIENVTCYNVTANAFSYDNAMNNLYDMVKGDIRLLDTMVLESIDFCCFGCDFRLQIELYDEGFYGITLIHNLNDGLVDENWRIIRHQFYNCIKPICGNEGAEKSLYSICSLNKEDVELFRNHVYIRNMVAGCLSKARNQCEELEDGVFYAKLEEKDYSKLLECFLNYRRK